MAREDSVDPAEVSIVRAIQCGVAEKPQQTFVWIAKNDKNQTFHRVTNLQAHRIVARLIAELQDIFDTQQWGSSELQQRQPSIVTLMVVPTVHAIFHLFALWVMGIGVQYVDETFEEELLDILVPSNTELVIYAGLNVRLHGWLEARKSLQLSPKSYARSLAKWAASEEEKKAPPLSWPSKIKSPPICIISHTSATTGTPKLLRYSMHYWTIELDSTAKAFLARANDALGPGQEPRPRLITSRPFFQTFVGFIILQMYALRPFALLEPKHGGLPCAQEVLDTIMTLNAGDSLLYNDLARNVMELAKTRPEYLTALQKHRVGVAGATVDESLEQLSAELHLQLSNVFGISEVTAVMVGGSPMPLNHLIPVPNQGGKGGHHLFLPLSKDDGLDDEKEGQNDEYQLWSLVERWERLQHALDSELSPTLQAEPYPGPGEHYGKPAVNWSDVFQLVDSPNSPTKKAYIHLGRTDDVLKHSNARGTNAIIPEARLLNQARQILGSPHVLSAQYFGTGKPTVAAVIHITSEGDKLQLEMHMKEILDIVNQGLASYSQLERNRVQIVVGQEKGALLLTHKGSLRRRVNERNWQSWLDDLSWTK